MLTVCRSNSTTTTTTATDGGYKGCYVDGEDRTMPHQRDGSFSIEGCKLKCTEDGYAFAGLQHGAECHCSETLPTSEKLPDGDCDSVCAKCGENNGDCADGDERFCGGFWKNSVYELAVYCRV